MPKVVVYVPAAAWKKLKDQGLDPAVAVREFARRGYEFVDGSLSERADESAGQSGSARTSGSLPGGAKADVTPSSPAARSESDLHFRPDFK